MITEAADLVEKVSALLAPYDADEWASPSGRRMDLPNRGNILGIPVDLHKKPTTVGSRHRAVPPLSPRPQRRRPRRCMAQLFDWLLGYTAFNLSGSLSQRTAFFHVDYRASCRSKSELRVDASLDGIEDARCSSQDGCSTGKPCWPKPTRCS